ncbi:MAG: biopolymer transporter ExbD [Planctomycetes bacterium]|nr:biopolymer transporter ExbD [Planctomycetota bacterium]MBI3845092.1 biopolymer transporter ExbD [Planctomycetota bacterium]
MAGSQDLNENPVAINVVPMVDVIFCLCVFFMCSFRFKQIEGKLDLWLPKSTGAGSLGPALLDDVRVALLWDEAHQRPIRRIGQRRIESDDELATMLREAHRDRVHLAQVDESVTIDADARIRWSDVVNVMDVCKREQFDQIELTYGGTPAR